MGERSVYDIEVNWTEPEFDYEVRQKMSQTDTLAYLKSVITSSAYGKPTTIKVTRQIPE
jgi:hypothetical protein